ncbi:MAG: haloacid dehalogenase-like hydrolase [Xanthomonadaceae bacterium]|nr:haloacid dehalogenase-like hydrolase [Xanthomonadaceae bacterium]
MSGAPSAPGGRLVLFDFDGVIVAGDSFAAWLRREGLKPPLRRLAGWLAAPVGLPLMAFPATLSLGARLFLHAAVQGADPAVLRASLDAWGRALARRPGRVIGDGLAALRAHVAAGDRVAVVSGTESTLLRAVLDELGVVGVGIVASELDLDGRFARVRRHCFGAGKLHALAAAGIEPPWDVAYSDSPNDLPLLRHAREAVCVNWRTADRSRACAAPGGAVRFVDWR